MKKNEGSKVMANNNSRTLAFQTPEEPFNRIKAHLERETGEEAENAPVRSARKRLRNPLKYLISQAV